MGRPSICQKFFRIRTDLLDSLSGRAFSMRRIALLLCLVAGFMTPAAFGQESIGDIPKVIVSGFDAYKMGGPGEAMRTWLRGSAVEGTADAITQASALHSAQELYGPWRGYEIISTHQISASTRILYITINYDKGPLFAKFTLYRSEQFGWIVSSLLFNTNDAEVLPLQ